MRKLPSLTPRDINADHKGDFSVMGFMGAPRKIGKLVFAPLTRAGATLQIMCSAADSPSAYKYLTESIPTNSAIEVVGHVKPKVVKPAKNGEVTKELQPWETVELVVREVKCLGEFPTSIPVGEVANYTPAQRHLQIRFSPSLQSRLRFRSEMTQKVHQHMSDFTHVDTPILFKSTPEGAREFLVPTRDKGMAYALPQSPQQYKQILMASGVDRYYQMAHCFRDEDLRADRQPEFIQLDLEMAFAKGSTVRERVEALVKQLWEDAERIGRENNIKVEPLPSGPFPVMNYNDAMALYGVDKPDTRIKDQILPIRVPPSLQKMMTSLSNPDIEAFKFNLDASPREIRSFISSLLDSPDFRSFNSNPDGAPSVFVHDPSAPLEGLHAFGHEGLDDLKKDFHESAVRRAEAKVEAVHRIFDGLEELWLPAASDNRILEAKLREEIGRKYQEQLYRLEAVEHEYRELEEASLSVFQPGDLIIVQPRKAGPFHGGSTPLGRLRTLIHKAAVEQGLIEMPKGYEPLWVVDFPLFTPTEPGTTEPGQGGSAGFSATHHPFTAPKSAEDVMLAATNPLDAKADHYDLVINGVELGGGSGRIHNAEFQEFVLRKVLGMSDVRVEDFRHLLEALGAGCPPHAGLALGWDRLVAMWCGKESIRDVLAFPKDGKGKDAMVKSPSLMTKNQLDTYSLSVNGRKE